MTWLDQPLLALDSETTGMRPDFDRILTLCIGRSSKLGTWVSRTWRINPGVPIPPESTAVHGIGDADVTGWAQPFDALIEIGQWLDAAAANRRPLVLHHAPFDLSLIDAELRRHTGQGIPDGLIVLDTLCLFRRFGWRACSTIGRQSSSRSGGIGRACRARSGHRGSVRQHAGETPGRAQSGRRRHCVQPAASVMLPAMRGSSTCR